LDRIGSAGDVTLQDRLDITVIRPSATPGGAPVTGRLRRSALPAPLHLVGALGRYPHLQLRDRLALGRAVWALRALRLGEPSLDRETFGAWLAARGQSSAAVAALWDLITVPTVNLPAAEASLAMGAKVFQTGLLRRSDAADIGWSRVPLGRLHGERAAQALARAEVKVRRGVRVLSIEARDGPQPRWVVRTGSEGGGPGTSALEADAVVVAVAHPEAAAVLPTGALPHQDRLADLGQSPIIDVHLVFDRPVMALPFVAAVGSPLQWIFDRTASSGMPAGPGAPQYLAASLSSARDLLGRLPGDLGSWAVAELARLLPAVRQARLVDTLVTKERAATFAAVPGTAALRPPARTLHPGLAVAGAWTDTGWPATMEGAVRSGHAAAAAVLGADRPQQSFDEEVA